MDRGNHYETAFESYLQEHRIPYVAADETRRSYLGDERVKSLDFLVIGQGSVKLLVDIKGRRYPGGSAERPRRVWECWSTRSDIDGLSRWAERFGADYRPLLVFLYAVMPFAPDLPEGEEIWTWHDKRYVLRAVSVDEYQRHMRCRSPKWGTVSLSRVDYQKLVQPFPVFLRAAEQGNEAGSVPVPF